MVLVILSMLTCHLRKKHLTVTLLTGLGDVAVNEACIPNVIYL